MSREGGEVCRPVPLRGVVFTEDFKQRLYTHTHNTHTHTQLCQPCHVHSLSDVFMAPSGETLVGASSLACQPHYRRAHSPTTKVDLTRSPLASLVSLSVHFHPFVTPSLFDCVLSPSQHPFFPSLAQSFHLSLMHSK